MVIYHHNDVLTIHKILWLKTLIIFIHGSVNIACLLCILLITYESMMLVVAWKQSRNNRIKVLCSLERFLKRYGSFVSLEMRNGIG